MSAVKRGAAWTKERSDEGRRRVEALHGANEVTR
jgi:hypothetical protein